MKGTLIRFAAGGAVLAVMLLAIAVPASAAVTVPVAPIVSVANPEPGGYFRRGTQWFEGVACDPNASMTDATAGISRIQLFIGDRDLAIGTAFYKPGGYVTAATASINPDFSSNLAQYSRLGLNNPDVSTGCKSPNAGFRLYATSIKKGIYNFNLYVQTKAGFEQQVTIANVRVDHP